MVDQLSDPEAKPLVVETLQAYGSLEHPDSPLTVRPHKFFDQDYKFEILSYHEPDVNGELRPVLHHVKATIPAGNMCAVLGQEKRALFDVLTGNTRGPLLGTLPSTQDISFVPSENLMVEYETVEDVMWFYADLTLPNTSKEEKRQLIAEAVADVHLTHVYKCVVGEQGPEYEQSSGRLSSGERRRLQVCAMVLSKPRVVLLDEPTTGLDASMAMQLIRILKGLCRTKGMVIAACLHQPRREIYEEIDRILLLAKGHCIYFGDTQGMERQLVQQYRPIDRQANPADYAMDYLCSLSSAEAEKMSVPIHESEMGAEPMLGTESQPGSGSASPHRKQFLEKTERPPMPRRVYVLLRRFYHANCYAHSKSYVVPIYIWCIMSAAIFGLCCFTVDKSDIMDMQNFIGIQVLIVLLFVRIAMVTELNLIAGRAMWYIERRHGLYTLLDFFVAFEVVSCINSFLYAIFMYTIVWLIGSWDLQDWRNLPLLFCIFFIPLQAMRAVTGFAFVTSSDNSSGGVKVLTLLLLFQLFGGSLVNMTLMPRWIGWVCFLNPYFYLFFALMKTELDGFTNLSCFTIGDADEVCLTGDDILKPYGFNQLPLAVTLACVPIYLLASTFNVCMMQYYDFSVIQLETGRTVKRGTFWGRWQKYVQAQFDSFSPYEAVADTDCIADEDQPEALAPGPPLSPTSHEYIKYKNLIYTVTNGDGVQSILLGAREEGAGRRQGISFQIQANSLFAIMGPSGAGKTCLLRIIAGLTMPGTIEVDKVSVLGKHQVKFVADSTILPPMDSVEEVMMFYAEFVLGSTLNKDQRRARVNEVMALLGLEEKRHTFVGGRTPSGAVLDGITNGDSRLLAIGCAILREPRVLTLDEPTSGLHSFDAQRVVTILQTLAMKGTTVITTIHQPSLTLYNMFHAVMIMAKGTVVYVGSPLHSATPFEIATEDGLKARENPADFIMDCVGGLPHSEVVKLKKRLEAVQKDIADNTTKEETGNNDPPLTARSITGKEEVDVIMQRWRAVRFLKALHLISFRLVRDVWRDPRLFVERLFLPFVGSLVIAAPFTDMSDADYIYSSEIFPRECLILLTISYIYFMSAPTASVVQRNRQLYLHEITLSIYTPGEVYTALIVVSIILYVILPTFTVFLLVSTLSGLRPGFGYWLCSLENLLLMSTFCEVFAAYVGIGSFDESSAHMFYNSVFNVLLLPCTGILIASKDIEYPMKAVAYANPIRLAAGAEILNVFADRKIIVDSTDIYMQYTNGNQVVRDLGFDVFMGGKFLNQTVLMGVIVMVAFLGYWKLKVAARALLS